MTVRKCKEISLENLCVGNIWIFVCEYCGLKVKPKNKLISMVKLCKGMIIQFVLILIV